MDNDKYMQRKIMESFGEHFPDDDTTRKVEHDEQPADQGTQQELLGFS